MHSLTHSAETDPKRPLVSALMKKFGSNALPFVLHFKNSVVTTHQKTNLRGWAAGMAVNIRKRLL